MKAILISGAANTGKTTIAKRFAKEYAAATQQFGTDITVKFSRYEDLEKITPCTRIIIVDEYQVIRYSDLLLRFALQANTLDLTFIFTKQMSNVSDNVFFYVDVFGIKTKKIKTKYISQPNRLDNYLKKQTAELMQFAMSE